MTTTEKIARIRAMGPFDLLHAIYLANRAYQGALAKCAIIDQEG